MGRKVTHRRVRVDFWTHPKMAGLSVVEKAVVLWLATGGHPSCIVQVSERRAHRSIDPEIPDTLFRSSVSRLVELGIIRWDEDLEILWLIEGLDEQGFTGEKNERSTCKHLEVFPICQITREFAIRYPQCVPDALTQGRNRVSDRVSHPSESVDGGASPATAPATATKTATADVDARARVTAKTEPTTTLADVVGTTVGHGHLHMLDIARRQFAGEVNFTIPPFGGQAELMEGLERVVGEYGWDEVVEVCRHSWGLLVEGAVPEVYVRRMFIGDGFEARREAYHEATDKVGVEEGQQPMGGKF